MGLVRKRSADALGARAMRGHENPHFCSEQLKERDNKKR